MSTDLYLPDTSTIPILMEDEAIEIIRQITLPYTSARYTAKKIADFLNSQRIR